MTNDILEIRKKKKKTLFMTLGASYFASRARCRGVYVCMSNKRKKKTNFVAARFFFFLDMRKKFELFQSIIGNADNNIIRLQTP